MSFEMVFVAVSGGGVPAGGWDVKRNEGTMNKER